MRCKFADDTREILAGTVVALFFVNAGAAG